MGHVHVDATIRGTRQVKARFLVDTGATYSLITPELAARAGITAGPVRDRVRLATGKTVRLPAALGAVRVDSREASTIFWIGACDEPLLGVETLEALGLALDPVTGRLHATRAWVVRLGALREGTRAISMRPCALQGIGGQRAMTDGGWS